MNDDPGVEIATTPVAWKGNIDVSLDFRLDSKGRDPDLASPTLRRYHQFLWSKPLRSGAQFQLDDLPGSYLRHDSKLGKFDLASDTISNSFRHSKRMSRIVDMVEPSELDSFQRLGSTIGAKTLFPGNRVQNKPTLNAARGFNSKISDRFDLTLECIRLHFLGGASPLSSTLDRYSDFFSVFGSFEGYVEFFLLQDLVRDWRVRFFLPFVGFDGVALPANLDEYLLYMEKSMEFVERRNIRIASWVGENANNA